MASFDPVNFELGLSRFLLFKSDNGGKATPNLQSDDFEEQKLALWVKNKQIGHEKFKKGQSSDLTRDKIKILHQAGFPFKLSNDERWDRNLKWLSSFNNVNGHTRMPRAHEADGLKVGEWVHNQRKAMKAYASGKRSSLTPQRIDQLNSIEFEWNINDWDAMYQQLQQFKIANEHCHVPRKCETNKPLGRWVAYQREIYKSKEAGEKSTITKKQIQQLNSIEFEWTG